MTNNPNGEPEPEGSDANKASDSEKPTVILMAQDFKISEVLKHIEAGRIVLIVLAPPSD